MDSPTRTRNVSIYGRSRRLSVGAQIEVPTLMGGEGQQETIENLMAVMNRTSAGQIKEKEKEKPEDFGPQEATSDRAKEAKKFLNEKFASMKSQVEEGGYNPLRNRRRAMSGDSDNAEAFQASSIPHSSSDSNFSNDEGFVVLPTEFSADMGELTKPANKPLPTKKTMQKLKEKLIAKANLANPRGKEEREDSDIESSTQGSDEIPEKSKILIKGRKGRSDEHLPDSPAPQSGSSLISTSNLTSSNYVITSNAPIASSPGSGSSYMPSTPPPSFGALRKGQSPLSNTLTKKGQQKGEETLFRDPSKDGAKEFAKELLREREREREKEREKEREREREKEKEGQKEKEGGQRGRHRSFSSAANSDRPGLSDQIKARLKVDTNILSSSPLSEITTKSLVTPGISELLESDQFFQNERLIKKLEDLDSKYGRLLGTDDFYFEAEPIHRTLSSQANELNRQIESSLSSTLNCYAPMNEESSEIRATLAKSKQEKDRLTVEMSLLHDLLEADAKEIESGFEELAQLSLNYRQAVGLSTNPTTLTEFFWVFISWLLAAFAALLWLILSAIKFFRGGLAPLLHPASSLTNPTGAPPPILRRTSTLENLSTNPEVWRKKLRSYFDKRHAEEG